MTAHAFLRLGLPVQQGDFKSGRPNLQCHRDVAGTVALYTSNSQQSCQTQMGHIPERKCIIFFIT